MNQTHECFGCGTEISTEERARVKAKWDDHFGESLQSTMCWKCADNLEPGDEFYERLPEVVADRACAIYEAAKDAGRCK